MSLRKSATKTNQSTIDAEVEGKNDAVEAEREELDEAPFPTGDPVDAKPSASGDKAARPEPREVEIVPDQPRAVAVAPRSGNVMAEMADDGFEGLELGFGSFPIISLKNEGVFEDTEGNEYDEDFDCIIQQTRTKYVIKNTRTEKQKDEEIIYSYDGVVDSNDQPVEDTIKEWAEQGWGYETKPYLEVTALLVDEDGAAGDMVLLSIPKTSTKRLSGFIAQNRMRRGLMPPQYVTKCSVGDKIENVDFPFYPWKFEFVSQL